jgi:ribosomal protein S18 acetylase RimI-like enzyme
VVENGWTVRVVTGADWQKLRDLRLRALTDDPQAFGSTFAEEASDPDSEWVEWAEGSELGRDSRTFVAVAHNAWHGMVFASLLDDGDAGLFALWVAPSYRQQGVAAALVEAVIGWARERSAPAVALSVAEDNEPAKRLFSATGFAYTGVRRPLPSRPAVATLAMRRLIQT